MIPVFVAVPLAVAFLLPLLTRRWSRAAEWFTAASMLLLAGLAVVTVGEELHYYMGGWPIPLGIELRLDGLTSLMLLALNGVGLAVCLFSIDYMRAFDAGYRYYSLLLLLIAGANGVVVTGDLFNLYVFMEIAVIASYALIGLGGDHEGLEASFKYAVLGTLSSSLILIAIAIVYAVTGTLNMTDIAVRINDIGIGPALMLAAALLLSGFSLKAGLVPFHAWLPDAYPSAPAPVSALLAGIISKVLGIYVLARLLYNVLGANADMLTVIRWLGVISMVVGALLATAQRDFKRVLAYSSISQAGYIVLGLGLGTPLGIVGGLYHLLNHAAFKTLLFLNAGAVERATGTRDLHELGGLRQSLPVTSVTSLIASLSIAGIPPFNGFWSKLIIVIACVQAGSIGLAVIAVVVSVLTLTYQLRLQHLAFFAVAPTSLSVFRGESAWMAGTMIVLAVACGGLSLLVVGGIDSPLLISSAQAVLSAGRFVF